MPGHHDAARRRPEGRWNHNLHYHRLILDAVPPGARAALDVGCGEGTLCRALRERVPSVTGIDPDADSIARARAAGGAVDYVLGDFLAHDLAPGSFDVVTSVAALHHMDVAVALARMRELLRPGGVLAVIGLGRRTPADLPWDAAGFVAHRVLARRYGYWQHPSPVTDPALSHRELRRVVADLLPGARYRRHALFRFSLVWTRTG